MKALLANHQFSDNIIPSKLKSTYETGSALVVETPIEKVPLPDNDLEPKVTNEVKVDRQSPEEDKDGNEIL